MFVISIITIISSVILARTSSTRARARDASRVAGIGMYVLALEQYKELNGEYPTVASSGTAGAGGWRVSYLPNFMQSLQPYLTNHSEDPLDIGPPPGSLFAARPDGAYYYMYDRYETPGSSYGCTTQGRIAIIGFRAVETNSFDKTKFPQARCGPMPCAGGGTPGVCRDWSTEFDYSVMLVE